MRYGICFLYCFLKLSFKLAPPFNLRGVFFFTALETNCINVPCILIGSIECARLLLECQFAASLFFVIHFERWLKQRLTHFYVYRF